MYAKRVLLIAVAAVLFVACGLSGGRAIPEAEAQEEVALAKRLVADWAAGDIGKVAAPFTEEMKSALPPDEIARIWKELTDKHGAFQEQTGIRVLEISGFRAVFVDCRFEKGALAIQVTVDGDKKVAGLYLRPPSK